MSNSGSESGSGCTPGSGSGSIGTCFLFSISRCHLWFHWWFFFFTRNLKLGLIIIFFPRYNIGTPFLLFLSSIFFLHWMPSVFILLPLVVGHLYPTCSLIPIFLFPLIDLLHLTSDRTCVLILAHLRLFTYHHLTSSLTLTSLLAVLFTPMIRDAVLQCRFLTLQPVNPFAHTAYIHTCTHTFFWCGLWPQFTMLTAQILEYMGGGDLLNLLIAKDIFEEDFARFYVAEVCILLFVFHRFFFLLFFPSHTVLIFPFISDFCSQFTIRKDFSCSADFRFSVFFVLAAETPQLRLWAWNPSRFHYYSLFYDPR